MPQTNRLLISVVSLDRPGESIPLVQLALQSGDDVDDFIDVLVTADECVRIGTTLIKAARYLRELKPPGGSNGKGAATSAPDEG